MTATLPKAEFIKWVFMNYQPCTEAKVGKTIYAEMRIDTTSWTKEGVWAVAYYKDTGARIISWTGTLYAGLAHTERSAAITMPNKPITVVFEAHHWDGSNYVKDVVKEVTVALIAEEPVPPDEPPTDGLYICPDCGLSFATSDELMAHYQSVHEAPTPPPTEPPEIPTDEAPIRRTLLLTCKEYRAGSLVKMGYSIDAIKGAVNLAFSQYGGYRLDEATVDKDTIRLEITETGSPIFIVLIPLIIKFIVYALTIIGVYIIVYKYFCVKEMEAEAEAETARADQDKAFYDAIKELDEATREQLIKDYLSMQEGRQADDDDVDAWEMMQKFMEYLPYILIGVFVIIMLGYVTPFIPKPKGK